MIDRKARNKMAEILRHFISGQLSNFDFEGEVPSTQDEAVNSIFGSTWFFYDDLERHFLREKWTLPEATKSQMARWMLFLYTDEPYLWPKINYAGIRPLRYGLFSRLLNKPAKEQKFMASGNYAVWPFISMESFNHARQNPTLLADPDISIRLEASQRDFSPMLDAMIFGYSTDDRSLRVFASEAEAISYAEGIDVEAGVWQFFDSGGAPLDAVFTKPNTGRLLVSSGSYVLRAASGGNSLIDCLDMVSTVEGPSQLDTVAGIRKWLASYIEAKPR